MVFSTSVIWLRAPSKKFKRKGQQDTQMKLGFAKGNFLVQDYWTPRLDCFCFLTLEAYILRFSTKYFYIRQ